MSGRLGSVLRVAAAIVGHPLTGIVALVLGGLLLGIGSRDWNVQPEFYAVSAQVIPVFLLVIAVEGRFFRGQARRRWVEVLPMRFLLLIALVGVSCALAGVARGGDSVLIRGGTLLGLIDVMSGLFAFALWGPLPQEREVE